jgi:hypothetical protein
MFDHMIVFGEAHLRRILGAFAAYYNKVRVHRSCTATAASLRMIRADTPPGSTTLKVLAAKYRTAPLRLAASLDYVSAPLL